MRNTKILEIAGKKYTITANRRIIYTISKICPELLEFANEKASSKDLKVQEAMVGVKIFGSLDVLFYDMLKIAHPEISKEKSDTLLELADEEYNDFQEKLMELATSAFVSSTPNTSKKELNW